MVWLQNAIEPAVSLGTVVLASMMADLLWCVFMIAGLEHVEFKSGMGAANYFSASNIAMSHSLLMDGLWAGLLAMAYFLKRRNPLGAWVIFGAVLSHWLLDWISHRPDMPLAPGVHRLFRIRSVEFGGCRCHCRRWLLADSRLSSMRAPPMLRTSTGIYAYWIGVGVLTLAWYNNLAGPPPGIPIRLRLPACSSFA